MPPTVPVLGIPCTAIVFAQLVLNGENHGIRPFIVPLNDGHYMQPNVYAKYVSISVDEVYLPDQLTSCDYPGYYPIEAARTP